MAVSVATKLARHKAAMEYFVFFYQASETKNWARNVRAALKTDKDSLTPCKSGSCDM